MNDPQINVQPNQIDVDDELNPEVEKSEPELVDAQSYLGHEADPESIQETTTTDRANDLGIADEDDEHPQELNSIEYLARNDQATRDS